MSSEEGEALAREYNIHFFETSAKQYMHVEKAFITIATDVMGRLIADGGGSTKPTGYFINLSCLLHIALWQQT